MSQLIDLFSEKVVQRKAFLREVYRRTHGDSSQDVSYQHITTALSFHKADIEQACMYLAEHGYLTVYSGTMVLGVIPPPERDLILPPRSDTEKRIRLTDKGVSYVQQYCQDESA